MTQSTPGLSGRLLPIHPRILPDELLTSWLVRTATANGMKIQRLLDVAIGRNVPTLQRDYDRFAPEAHLMRFAEMTGEAAVRIEASTLRVFERTFVEHVRTNGNARWILAYGIYHRKRRLHGLQYCPQCLQADPIPYFRTLWRCAFYVECSEHHVQMQDACPRCDAPVVPFRVELGKPSSTLRTTMTHCHACDFDLRHAPCEQIEYATWQQAVDLHNLLAFHWFQDSVLIGGDGLSTYDTFLDWWQFAAMLRSSRAYLMPSEPEIAARVSELRASTIRFNQCLEVLRIKDRIPQLLLALWLLQDWPKHFEAAERGPSRRSRHLRERYERWSARVLSTQELPGREGG
jgi:TniQ